MSSEIIINANPRETRVGVMESHVAVEFYIDHKRDEDIVGNIYKGRVTRVLPGMQVAFVDIGQGKAGFLYVSDVDILDIMEEHENLLTKKDNEDTEKEDINFQRRRNKKDSDRSYLIEEVLQEGQEILVQVSKNPLGTKGARITTYITLPGRYLVFMPTIDHIGISRRIEDEEERKRLKKVIQDIRGTDAGYIVRTVGEGKNKEEFESDINFLGKLWSDIKNKAENSTVPALIYKDLDLIYRTLRDLFTQDVDQLIVDSPQVYERC
ncbi:MAG TPA: ribonuclease E/G, partial [Nitrospinota bacterium]|nr:ribonuclease E/G [Nitrospinota bacterium]